MSIINNGHEWRSDWYWVQQFLLKPLSCFGNAERYQASAAAAFTQTLLPFRVDELTPEQQALIAVRRHISKREFQQAEQILNELGSPEHATREHGDRALLKGLLANRKGDLRHAIEKQEQAYGLFQKAGLIYAAIRAKINVLSNEPGNCANSTPQALALEQVSRKNDLHELTGFICRSRAIDRLHQGLFKPAYSDAQEALRQHQLDSCPDEIETTRSILAITAHYAEHTEEAERLHQEIQPITPRVAAYHRILTALLSNQRPIIAEGHALAGLAMPLRKKIIHPRRALLLPPKQNSVPGKILSLLERNPVTSEEIIRSVWGENADHPSYEHRLHVTIHNLRKKMKSKKIEFDGKYYSVK